jgi:hypothetical protein
MSSPRRRDDSRRRQAQAGQPRRDITDPEAARRRHAWLDGRYRRDCDLVLVLLHYAPEPDLARALVQLPSGEPHHLARLLSQTTDLHHVARRIASDLHQRGARPARSAPPSIGWRVSRSPARPR